MASFFLRGFRNKNAKSSSQSCRLYSRGMCMAWTSKCLKKSIPLQNAEMTKPPKERLQRGFALMI